MNREKNDFFTMIQHLIAKNKFLFDWLWKIK